MCSTTLGGQISTRDNPWQTKTANTLALRQKAELSKFLFTKEICDKEVKLPLSDTFTQSERLFRQLYKLFTESKVVSLPIWLSVVMTWLSKTLNKQIHAEKLQCYKSWSSKTLCLPPYVPLVIGQGKMSFEFLKNAHCINLRILCLINLTDAILNSFCLFFWFNERV